MLLKANTTAAEKELWFSSTPKYIDLFGLWGSKTREKMSKGSADYRIGNKKYLMIPLVLQSRCWGQTSQILSCLSPKGDRGSKTVASAEFAHGCDRFFSARNLDNSGKGAIAVEHSIFGRRLTNFSRKRLLPLFGIGNLPVLEKNRAPKNDRTHPCANSTLCAVAQAAG